jgi:hypothetical protein
MMKPESKSIVQVWQCPYCERQYIHEQEAIRCHGVCSTADLLDKEFFYDSGNSNGPDGDGRWSPPKPLSQFKEWSQGDRAEFVRRLEAFFNKFYR